MARAACQAQTQGAAPWIHRDGDLGAEAASATPEGRIQPLVLRRPRRARVRARPYCPAAPRTAPAWPADRPSGAARRPARTRGPSGDRPSSLSRTRAAIVARRHPTTPSRTPRPRKGDHDLPGPRVYRDRYSEKNAGRALGHRSSARRSSGAILGAIRKERDSREDNRGRAGCPLPPFSPTRPEFG